MENFQCLNGGIARTSRSSTAGDSDVSLECRCMPGFDGQYCEKDISGEATSMTVLQICLYIFLFIILPSIILYTIRAVYLMLKRCGVVVSPNIEESQDFHSSRAALQLLTVPCHQPRPAFRTISLPVNATILVSAEPMVILEDGRRLHRTISWQPVSLNRGVTVENGAIPSPPPPPPSYLDTVGSKPQDRV